MGRAKRWAAAGALLLLLGAWLSIFSPRAITGDAYENIRLGHSLARHGVMSLDSEPPIRPSMRREPLPAAMIAASVLVIEAAAGPRPVEDYASGERARWLKHQNLIWLTLLTAGVWFAGRRLTGSVGGAVASVVLANMIIFGLPRAMIDTLYSDVAAAALLVISSLLLAMGTGRRGTLAMGAAGLVMGLLILTKATFLYVFAGLVVSLGLIALFRRGDGLTRARLAGLAAFAAVAALTIAPYMARNEARFGVFQVADRGGRVLLTRAYKDMMTPEEYRGAFYAWALPPLKPVMGALLGYSPKDLEIGGRLQRFNRDAKGEFIARDRAALSAGRPDQTLTYFRMAGARAKQLEMQFEAAGAPNPERMADEATQAEAVAIIRAHPWRHLFLTIPLLWRGGAFVVVFLFGVFAWALVRRRDDLAAFVLPALGMGAFMALLSHFIPRYIFPAAPVIAVCLVASAMAAWGHPLAQRLRKRLFRA